MLYTFNYLLLIIFLLLFLLFDITDLYICVDVKECYGKVVCVFPEVEKCIYSLCRCAWVVIKLKNNFMALLTSKTMLNYLYLKW